MGMIMRHDLYLGVFRLSLAPGRLFEEGNGQEDGTNQALDGWNRTCRCTIRNKLSTCDFKSPPAAEPFHAKSSAVKQYHPSRSRPIRLSIFPAEPLVAMDPFGLFAEFIEDLTNTNTVTSIDSKDPLRYPNKSRNIESPSICKSEPVSSITTSPRPKNGRTSTSQDQHHPVTAPFTANHTPFFLSSSSSNAQTWADHIGNEASGLDFTHNFALSTPYYDVIQQEPTFPCDLAYPTSSQYSQSDHALPWTAYHTNLHAPPDPSGLRPVNYPQYSPSHQGQLTQTSEPLLPDVGLPSVAQRSNSLCHCQYVQTHNPHADNDMPMLAKDNWGFNEAAYTDKCTERCR